MNDGSFTEERIRHLEMIQGVVTRLSSNSFVVKGWAITLAGALFGFAIDRDSVRIGFVALAPITIFWILDTYFLRVERLFRALYEQVRQGDPEVGAFFMGATGETFIARVREGKTRADAASVSWWGTATSVTLVLIYLGLLFATVIVVAIIATTRPAATPRHANSSVVPGVTYPLGDSF